MPHSRKAKVLILTWMSFWGASCAKPEYPLVQQRRQGQVLGAPIQDARVVNAPPSKVPKILPETHFAAARLFEQQGNLSKAIMQYRKAIAVNHRYVAAYHRLGLVLSRAQRHSEAVASLERAVELAPNNAVLWNDFGFELMYRKHWDRAEAAFRKAINRDPTLARAHINLGLALSKQSRFDQALASFRAVLPEADAYYNLGLMYRGQSRYADAVEAFEHILTAAPGFTAAKTQLEQMALRIQPKRDEAMVRVGSDRWIEVRDVVNEPRERVAEIAPVVPEPREDSPFFEKTESRVNKMPAAVPHLERTLESIDAAESPAYALSGSMTELISIVDNEVRCLEDRDESKNDDLWSDSASEAFEVEAAIFTATIEAAGQPAEARERRVMAATVIEIPTPGAVPDDPPAWPMRWNMLADRLISVRAELQCLDDLDAEQGAELPVFENAGHSDAVGTVAIAESEFVGPPVPIKDMEHVAKPILVRFPVNMPERSEFSATRRSDSNARRSIFPVPQARVEFLSPRPHRQNAAMLEKVTGWEMTFDELEALISVARNELVCWEARRARRAVVPAEGPLSERVDTGFPGFFGFTKDLPGSISNRSVELDGHDPMRSILLQTGATGVATREANLVRPIGSRRVKPIQE